MGATVRQHTVTHVATAAARSTFDQSGVSPLLAPGSRGLRPQLSLVPTGRQPVQETRAGRPALRLTRFGRLTVTVATLAAVIALGVGLTAALASASPERRPVTVESGQTLSEIAARELPDLSVREGVVSLQLVNEMSTEQVHAGQRLLVPVP